MNTTQTQQAKACDIFAKLQDTYTDHHDSNGRISAGDMEFFVSDVLADLRHFCDAHGLDFACCDKRARGHYIAELSE